MNTLKKHDNYGEILQQNDQDKICPFQSPVPVPMQNSLGQTVITLIRMPCSSVCPFVEIVSYPTFTDYYTKCNGQQLKFEITQQKNTIINP